MDARAKLRRSDRSRLRFWVAVLFLLFAGGYALVHTAAVSAVWQGGVEPPEVVTPVASRPATDQPLVRLAALGDVGTGEPDQYAVAAELTAFGNHDPYDALVLLGDNVYPDGDPARLDATVFQPFGRVLEAGAELLPVLGNHDAGYAAAQVAALGMPGRWYAAEIGDVLFLGLDSTDAENPAQVLWLERTLARSTARWTIAAMHHPPFSAGLHGSDEDTRDTFVPLFERYGVELVLSGHDHDYQRSAPIGGVTYVVSGGGSKVRPTGTADFTAEAAAILHFVELAVWNDRLELTAIGLDGAFDHAVLRDWSAPPTVDARFATGVLLGDDEPSTGAHVAGIGAVVWLLVLGTSWLLPGASLGRIGKVLVAASTASMLTVIAGVGMVTLSLVF